MNNVGPCLIELSGDHPLSDGIVAFQGNMEAIGIRVHVGGTGSAPGHEMRPLKGFCIALLVLGCTLALASLSFHGMESRLIALGRKLKYFRSPPVKPVQAAVASVAD